MVHDTFFYPTTFLCLQVYLFDREYNNINAKFKDNISPLPRLLGSINSTIAQFWMREFCKEIPKKKSSGVEVSEVILDLAIRVKWS